MTGLIASLITIMKYIRDPMSKEDFSYLLKDDTRPQTTRMHRISSDLSQFWRTRTKDKEIIFTVFCHKNVPDSLLVEPLPVYEVVNSLIGRAFYKTETGRIHVHVTYDTKTPKSGVLNIIIANTGNGDLSPITVGHSQKIEVFNLNTLGENIERIHGQYSYKTASERGTEFIITIPSDIYFPPKHQNGDKRASQIDHPNKDEIEAETASKPLPRTLESMGQTDITRMKAIRLLDNKGTAPSQVENKKIESNTEPIAPIKSPVVSRPKPTHSPHKGFEKIKSLDVLIVEDQNSNQETIRAMLEPLEHTIIYAENGQTALNILSTHQFDYIIMDINMSGTSGIETSKLIRQSQTNYANIPIIGLTADAKLETAHNGLGVGIDIVLTKPTTTAILFESIRVVLESRAAGQNDQSHNLQKRA
ncbi:MAG: response regulator [Maricaulaceae bacterium]